MTTTQATIIDTPNGIEFFRLISIIGRLKIETSTGVKFRTPTLKAGNLIYGLNYKRKADLLAHLETARDLVKTGEFTLLPTGDPNGPQVGLYDVAELAEEG